MRMLRLIALILPCVVASTASADANSLVDYFGPREMAVGEAMRGNAQGASSIALNPAGLTTNRQVVFEGYGGFRDDDGAIPLNVAACDSTVPVGGCFYYRYFSAKPEVGNDKRSRRVHESGMTLAKAISPIIHVGMNGRYFDYNTDLMGEDDASGFAFDAGLVIKPTPRIGLGVTGYNLITTKDTAQYPMGVGAGVTAQPINGLSIGLDGSWNLDTDEDTSSGRYGVGGEYLFQAADQQSAYPIRVGGIKDNELDASFFTAGVGFVSSKIGIDIGFRQELGGEKERLILAGVRVFGPSVR